MTAIPLGKITVATAGTPVPITAALVAAAGGQLPPSGGVAKVEVWADPAMVGTTAYVKVGASIIAPLPKPSGARVFWCACAPGDGDTINPAQFSIDVATSGDGAYVTIWVN